MVADARVGSDVGFGADVAVVADDGWAHDGGPAGEDCVSAYSDVVRYGCFDYSVVVRL